MIRRGMINSPLFLFFIGEINMREMRVARILKSKEEIEKMNLKRNKTKQELIAERNSINKEIKKIENEENRILEEHRKNEAEYKAKLQDFTYRSAYRNENKSAFVRFATMINAIAKANPNTTDFSKYPEIFRMKKFETWLEANSEEPLQMPTKAKNP